MAQDLCQFGGAAFPAVQRLGELRQSLVSPSCGDAKAGMDHLITQNFTVNSGKFQFHADYQDVGKGFAGFQALNRRDEAFDAVLLDYRLPDRQDSSLLEEVRTLAPTVLVFMMTAYCDDTMRTVSQWLGARAVVDKPFQLDTFVEMIETAFEPTN